MTHPVGLDPDPLRAPLVHGLPSEDPLHVDDRVRGHVGRGTAVIYAIRSVLNRAFI